MNCPNCGGDAERGRWAPGGCTCRREPRREADATDEALNVAGSCDYITPVAETFDLDKYVLFVFAVVGTFGVILTKGILWG